MAGIVRPRGSSHDYAAHVLGEGVATDVTSWTSDSTVAKKFGDIILKIDDSNLQDRIVPHPFPGRYPHEGEVLIRGLLENVEWSKWK